MKMNVFFSEVENISNNDLFKLYEIKITDNKVTYCFLTDCFELLWIDDSGISGPLNLSENYIDELRIVQSRLKEQSYI